MADNEAQKLKSQQNIAKARARTKIFEELEVDKKFLDHDKQKFIGSSQNINKTNTDISHHQRNEHTVKH